MSRRLVWRIPNVALACPVDLTEERRASPAKASVSITLPHGTRLEGVHHLSGADGSRWRIETLPNGDVVAHEV